MTVWTVAAFTVRELLRRQVLLVALVLTAAFLALYGTGLHYAADDVRGAASRNNAMASLFAAQLLLAGLYFGSFLTAFLAIFAAVGTLSAEIDSGLILAVAARPLPRWHIVLGKFAGYGALIVLYAAALFLGVLLLCRYQLGMDVSTPPAALALFCLEPLVLLATALLGSSFLSTLANGAAVVMLYGLSLIGGMMEQIGALIGKESLVTVGIVSSLVMPADALYRAVVHTVVGPMRGEIAMAARMMGPFGAVTTPSAWMIGYAAAFALGAVALAMRTFARRDL